FFFFQAEDGIRDFHVTGVQTCALPICRYFQRDEGHLTFARGRGSEIPPTAAGTHKRACFRQALRAVAHERMEGARTSLACSQASGTTGRLSQVAGARACAPFHMVAGCMRASPPAGLCSCADRAGYYMSQARDVIVVGA